MDYNKGSVSQLEEIEKLTKPSTMTLILITLICLSPYGHLVLRIIQKNHSELFIPALLVFPTLTFLSAYWVWHFYRSKNYKKIAKEIAELLDKES